MFNQDFIKKLEEMANRKTLAEQGGQQSIDRAYAAGDAYLSGVEDGQTYLARMVIGLSAAAASGATMASSSSSFTPSSDAVANSVGDVVSFAPDVINLSNIGKSAGQESVREVECVGDCTSVGKFVSADPTDSGSILDSVGDVLSSVADGVGDVFSGVGDVISSIAD